MKFFFTASIVLFGLINHNAQVIYNAYAKVSAISGSSVLTVTNVNEANHTFTIGGNVILMQMQDDVIGTNTTNASTFGNLSAINNAGIYEIRSIIARSPAAGTPTSITLSAPVSAAFNTGANSSVQLITFRNLGTNFTTSSNITGLTWDGNVGGVIAIDVTNTLTLNHSITANAIGFRGGVPSVDDGAGCNSTTYLINSTAYGYKGEGIYKSTNTTFNNGRGHLLNGGGGGNPHNSGGGGGGNYTAGGDGGPGYACSPAAAGLGGVSLSAQISASRIFMGGGGGGPHRNNGYVSNGGNGGGIILIKASMLLTNTTCGSAIGITANGGTAINVGNDGAGGGGAAGTIVLNVTTFSVSSTCTLAINANGGGGGSCTDGAQHAGGGGGAQGAVLYSTAQPTTNMQTTTNNGAGGQNSNGGSYAASGSGSSNTGIIPSASGPLPIELVDFTATLLDDKVKLTWFTLSEKNNDYFTVESSQDGLSFRKIATIDGAGNSHTRLNYEYYDHTSVSGINYYRLQQTDFDGRYKYSPLLHVNKNDPFVEILFPNPIEKNGILTIICENDDRKECEFQLLTVTGKEIFNQRLFRTDSTGYKIDLGSLGIEKGIYYFKLKGPYLNSVKKLVVH